MFLRMIQDPKTILVLASYEKGHAFIQSCKEQGARVVLITSACLEGSAKWPTDSIDELFYMRDVDHVWDRGETLRGVSYLARSRVFDCIVPLDDFDVEIASMLREHLRLPGMGETTMHYFRDKLAMRMRARTAGLLIPDFVHLLNDAQINAFCERNPAPWVVKPRSSAGAIGIMKANSRWELWQIIDKLGDDRPQYLLEQFVAGDVFHVDSLWYRSEGVYARASRYGRPPLEVSHVGDVFTTCLLDPADEQARALVELNGRVLKAMHLVWGASHSEFIRGLDGQLYFLETSARVGGAHIADMIAAATGVNLWAEWAKIELAGETGSYMPPTDRGDYAGLLISLSRQDYPDTSAYSDPEIVWRLDKFHHVGFIVVSPSAARVAELIKSYTDRVRTDFHAIVPPKDKPAS